MERLRRAAKVLDRPVSELVDAALQKQALSSSISDTGAGGAVARGNWTTSMYCSRIYARDFAGVDWFDVQNPISA
jgi:hypothetical protein